MDCKIRRIHNVCIGQTLKCTKDDTLWKVVWLDDISVLLEGKAYPIKLSTLKRWYVIPDSEVAVTARDENNYHDDLLSLCRELFPQERIAQRYKSFYSRCDMKVRLYDGETMFRVHFNMRFITDELRDKLDVVNGCLGQISVVTYDDYIRSREIIEKLGSVK